MRLMALLAGAALLGACSSEPEVDVRNASVEEVVREVADARGGRDVTMRPGKWQTKVTVEDIAIPGMPASAAAQMKDFFAKQRNVTVDYCLTPEEARRPGGKFFTGEKSANCRYDHFTMSGGKVDAVMRCTGDGSGAMTMKMSGNYTPDSSTTRSEMEVAGGSEGGMTIKARTEARRVGECTPAEGEASGSAGRNEGRR